MIGLVTDSSAMLPASLVARLDATVVPLRFSVGDITARETGTIDLAWFYRELRAGTPVTTSAPAPGDFATVYADLADAGATEIVSVHVGIAYSGTVNAAQLAAASSPVPVRVVDSGVASFALGCCVWSAADCLAAGGNALGAIRSAEAAASGTASVFTVGEVERARTGGRIVVDTPAEGIPVLSLDPAGMDVLGSATDVGEAIDLMVDFMGRLPGAKLRIGVGDADDPEAARLLADALGSVDRVTELVRYRVGPSVAAHTGVGTFGAVAWAHGG